MSKRKVVKQRFLLQSFPITGTVVTYLLYKQLNLHGAAEGAFLTIAVLWWVMVWGVVISQLFLVEPSEPVFNNE